MTHKEELMQTISSIYRFAYANKNVHKNIMRKKLLLKSKTISKSKFAEAFDLLVKTGSLTVNKDKVSLNPNFVKLGVLQKQGNNYFVVTPDSDKHFDVDKSVAAGYKTGDLVSVIITNSEGKKSALVLGRAEKQQEERKEHIAQVSKNVDSVVIQSSSQDGLTINKTYAPQDENLLLGRVVKTSHDNLVFIPNKKSFEVRQIPILNRKEEWAAFQDKICIMKVKDINDVGFGGYITEVKGDAGNPIHEYDAIAESYGAIMNWNGENIEKEIAQIPTAVDLTNAVLIDEESAKYMQRGNIVDLRHLPFVTVDPATCKDMDDAIYSTLDEHGDIVTYTAVANVTKYVDLNSEIGQRYINAAA